MNNVEIKLLYALVVMLFLPVAGTDAADGNSLEVPLYYNTEFKRGDVVTVLISETESLYTLELVSSLDKIITDTIFFSLRLNGYSYQAALLGLDSTLVPGGYMLLVKDAIGVVIMASSIVISENDFKKEDIPLNYEKSSLRTDPDPEIVNQAVQIHKIYNRTVPRVVLENSSLLIPVENGIVTSWYGDRRKFIYSNGSVSGSIHTGIDIAAPMGTFIRAAHSGKVVFAGDRIITGKSVVLEYLPGVYGVFFHMEKLFVREGESVNSSTVVGSLGKSGLATGPHLHWEIRVGAVPVDPYSLVAGGLIDNSLIMSIVNSHTAEYSGRR